MVGFETKRKMRILDKVGKVSDLKPDEAAEAFIKVSEIMRIIPVPKKSLSDEGAFILRYASDKFGGNYDIYLYEKRKELLRMLLSLSNEEFESIKPALREDMIELSLVDFEPEARQDLILLMERCIKSKGVKHFRTSIFNTTPIVQLQIERNLSLLCAEPFYFHPDTAKEFDNKNDAADILSNIFFLVLYAKKRNLYDSEELMRDKIAVEITRRIHKLMVKSIKEKPEYIELSNDLKEGMFWEFLSSALKIEPFYKSLKNIAHCVLLSLNLDGSVTFTTLLGEGKFGFDSRSIRKFHNLKKKNNEAAFFFINSLGSVYYELQRVFAGNNVTVDREFETIVDEAKLWPVEILGDCVFDYNGRDGLKEFIGFKRLRIEFKDQKFINIQKTKESFLGVDPVPNTLLYLQTWVKGNTARFDYYFMPEIHKLLYVIWRDRRIDEAAVNYLNRPPSLFIKPFHYVTEGKKEGIVGYFKDLKLNEVEVKK